MPELPNNNNNNNNYVFSILIFASWPNLTLVSRKYYNPISMYRFSTVDLRIIIFWLNNFLFQHYFKDSLFVRSFVISYCSMPEVYFKDILCKQRFKWNIQSYTKKKNFKHKYSLVCCTHRLFFRLNFLLRSSSFRNGILLKGSTI